MAHDADSAAKAKATIAARPSRKDLALQLLREEVQRVAPELVEEFMEIAQHAEKAVVIPGTRDTPGTVEMVPDQDLRLKALRELYDRVFGKPSQALKLSGDPDGAPIRTAPEQSEERARKVAEILGQAGAVHEKPHNGRRRAKPPTRQNGARHG